ncbi:cell division protein FtsL [Acidiphilium sp.]|uniref:cell division protein FtsL n=1 Tax=Acidiphilium sp. TaxID=527 RepID=UPI003D0019E4
MIRPVTFITTIMALSSGAWMFVVKHQAEQLDRQIGGVTAQIRGSEQRIRVLRAEWALETDPNRLARLATMFLPELKPMLPDQLVTWSELADRLPPPGATIPHLPLPPPLPDQLPDTPMTTATPVAPPGPIASIAAPGEGAPPVALPPNAVPVASALSPPSAHHAPDLAAAHLAVARAVTKPHPARLIHRVTVVRHALPKSDHPVRSRPIPLGQSVLAPMRTVRPMGAQIMTINAQAAPMSAPISAPVPARISHPVTPPPSASVFGGYAADLPPPRPVAGSAP